MWRIIFALALLISREIVCAQEFVWWEGESRFNTNFPKECDFAAKNYPENRQVLSGNDWLCYSGPPLKNQALSAKYRIEIPADGEYSLWVRKFWHYGPFRWRFGLN